MHRIRSSGFEISDSPDSELRIWNSGFGIPVIGFTGFKIRNSDSGFGTPGSKVRVPILRIWKSELHQVLEFRASNLKVLISNLKVVTSTQSLTQRIWKPGFGIHRIWNSGFMNSPVSKSGVGIHRDWESGFGIPNDLISRITELRILEFRVRKPGFGCPDFEIPDSGYPVL